LLAPDGYREDGTGQNNAEKAMTQDHADLLNEPSIYQTTAPW